MPIRVRRLTNEARALRQTAQKTLKADPDKSLLPELFDVWDLIHDALNTEINPHTGAANRPLWDAAALHPYVEAVDAALRELRDSDEFQRAFEDVKRNIRDRGKLGTADRNTERGRKVAVADLAEFALLDAAAAGFNRFMQHRILGRPSQRSRVRPRWTTEQREEARQREMKRRAPASKRRVP